MQNLSLKKCILKGKQLNGEISGVISIKEPVMQSELNLSVTVQPQNDFLKNMPSGLIFGNLSGKNGFSFKVIGTIEKPDVSMAGSTAPSPQPSPARGEGVFSPP
jgi:hypothetical protein